MHQMNSYSERAYDAWATHTMENYSHVSPTKCFFPKFHNGKLMAESIRNYGLCHYYSTSPHEHSYKELIKKVTPFASNSHQLESVIKTV